MSKTYESRIQQKHDISENWAKAVNFIPLVGEIIVYDDLNKIKIGDGVSYVGDLPFVAAGIGQETPEGGEIFNDYENNRADGSFSHAEGWGTWAHSSYAHAEGNRSYAIGYASHAEGNAASAFGLATHVEGQKTIAGAMGYKLLWTDGWRIIVDDKNLPDNNKARNTLWYDGTKNIKISIDHTSHTVNTLYAADYDEATERILVEELGISKEDALYERLLGCSILYLHTLDGSDIAALKLQVDTSVDSDDLIENWVWSVDAPSAGVTAAFSLGASAGGEDSIAIGRGATAYGRLTKALGNYSHAEGRQTEAGYTAHAEGQQTKATGVQSHAEGTQTIAAGKASHAEGWGNVKDASLGAFGEGSHIEGVYTATTVAAKGSHAEGLGTIAAGEYQHVQGRYNAVDDEGKYLHIVGSGNSNNTRTNIHTISAYDPIDKVGGEAWFKAGVKVGGQSVDDAQSLATENYVNTQIAKNEVTLNNITGNPLPVQKGGTGVSTKESAALAVGAYPLYKGKQLGTSSNLNNLTTPDCYFCSSVSTSNAIAENSNATVANSHPCPGAQFTLRIFELTSNYIAQELIEVVRGTRHQRFYTVSSGKWGTWTSTVMQDKSGNVNIGGEITVGSDKKKLATEEYVNGVIPQTADYIVACGNTNGWYWEKWASGKATGYTTGLIIINSEGSYAMRGDDLCSFDTSLLPTLPFEFTEAPYFFIQELGDGSDIVINAHINHDGYNGYWINVTVPISSATSSYQMKYVSQFIGRWK